MLLAEDNDMNREIATELLELQGAEVIACEDGKKALEEFQRSGIREYDAILLDIRMPVMDGYEAAKAIRLMGAGERPDAADIPIIALTASDYEEDAQKCRQAGMDEHLPKPLDAGNLIRVIQKYLR